MHRRGMPIIGSGSIDPFIELPNKATKLVALLLIMQLKIINHAQAAAATI